LDVKAVRDMLIRFIKDQLQRFEGGEGGDIHYIQLFIACNKEEQPVYDTAVYKSDEGKFKLEIQRVADDYAIDLPEGWLLGVNFTQELPLEAIRDAGGKAAIIVNTKKVAIHGAVSARIAEIKILSGEAQQQVYEVGPASGRVNIGRGVEVRMDDGSVRLNNIAFSEDGDNAVNRFISRRHAHLEWNVDAGCLMIYADEGGIPPGNKTKIKTNNLEKAIKLNATSIGYRLADADQVILGDSAVLEVRYKD